MSALAALEGLELPMHLWLPGWAGLGWAGGWLGWAGLDWAGLGWAGLGWAGWLAGCLAP